MSGKLLINFLRTLGSPAVQVRSMFSDGLMDANAYKRVLINKKPIEPTPTVSVHGSKSCSQKFSKSKENFSSKNGTRNSSNGSEFKNIDERMNFVQDAYKNSEKKLIGLRPGPYTHARRKQLDVEENFKTYEHYPRLDNVFYKKDSPSSKSAVAQILAERKKATHSSDSKKSFITQPKRRY
ncbi:uncharacterized protein LOC119688885 [Teleopsis dalmanni]|uniref:uncharacterized protein LOC119688885 n=1 Tax=Teleopsis dalmanni TaxID=139649 RepID=UPI0018CDB84C|nr:uncharacterized protein LOC119688885 [Teleopsis dalmanni]